MWASGYPSPLTRLESSCFSFSAPLDIIPFSISAGFCVEITLPTFVLGLSVFFVDKTHVFILQLNALSFLVVLLFYLFLLYVENEFNNNNNE